MLLIRKESVLLSAHQPIFFRRLFNYYTKTTLKIRAIYWTTTKIILLTIVLIPRSRQNLRGIKMIYTIVLLCVQNTNVYDNKTFRFRAFVTATDITHIELVYISILKPFSVAAQVHWRTVIRFVSDTTFKLNYFLIS